MPRMITGEEICDAVRGETFIKGGDTPCAEGVKYDFRLSSRILKASFKRPVDAQRLSEAEKRELFIEPGEMVFVLTQERLALPPNMFAELSPKRKLSHSGILAVGGFCIDPRYEGRLLIGLFNFSSTQFPLEPGRKVIAATFYELQGEEAKDFPQPVAPFDDFPDELIALMKNYSPMSTQSVFDEVGKIRLDLEKLRDEIQSHEKWYERFREILEGHDSQIGKLISGLDSETESRKRGEDKLTDAIQGVKDTLAFIKTATKLVIVILSLLGTVGTGVLIGWLLKVLKLT